MGHFVSSPREREKRDSRGDERKGQGRKCCRYSSEACCAGEIRKTSTILVEKSTLSGVTH